MCAVSDSASWDGAWGLRMLRCSWFEGTFTKSLVWGVSDRQRTSIMEDKDTTRGNKESPQASGQRMVVQPAHQVYRMLNVCPEHSFLQGVSWFLFLEIQLSLDTRIRISCSASLDRQCTLRTFARLKPGRSCRAGTLILTSPLYPERLGNTLTSSRKKQNKTNTPPNMLLCYL